MRVYFMTPVTHLKTTAICMLLALLCLCTGSSPRASETSLPADTQPWRIAYFEGGPYKEFSDSLHGLLSAFHDRGWLPEAPHSSLHTSRELWNWAADQKSVYVDFSRDRYYTADWDRDQRAAVRRQLYRDLSADEADMVLGMGTWAGLDLKDKEPGVPVVLMAVSDALNVGMFKNDEPGNPPWLHVRLDPQRNMRQLRIFHDTVAFSTLGVVFQDTMEGRSYAALDAVHSVARERGFKVKTCAIPDEGGREAEEKRLLECYKELTGKVEAFYVTENWALNKKTFPLLVAHTLENRMPTFSQMGAGEVRAGLLMSLSSANFLHVGEFTADIISRIMEGETPGALPMVFEDPPVIALNMMTAKKIRYTMPIDVLDASDQIFLEIRPLE